MIERAFNRWQYQSNRKFIKDHILREKWLNRSIMRYRRTPTSISPWWFVKSSRSSLRFIFANISCSSNHYFLISDYHWISNWIFTLTNSILPSKNIIPIKKFPINSYAKINIFNPLFKNKIFNPVSSNFFSHEESNSVE